MSTTADHRGSNQVTRAVLNEEEQAAMGALLGVMNTITTTWGMKANSGELASAIHVVQGFIVQHMLHRLEPAEWGSWEGSADA